jgi:hypothetical protein
LKGVGYLSSQGFSHRHKEGILSAISAGFFLVLIGLLFIVNTNLGDKTINFFKDITLVNATNTVTIGNTTSSVMLPAPAHVADHIDVYSAVEQFSLIWGVFLVAILGLRFAIGAPTRRKAQNVSDIVFWFGTAYLIQTWLINNITTAVSQTQKWFEVWALIIVLLGASLIVRAIFLAVTGATHRQ